MGRALLVEGSFGPVSLDDVLDVVSMSRQCMEVVFDGALGRSLVVKAGSVLAATAPPNEQGRSAFRTLYARPGRTYAVYQRDRAPETPSPVGTLAELIADARRVPSQRGKGPAPDRTPSGRIAIERVIVLEGGFTEHPFADVLDVVGLSRQRMELRTERADGSWATVVVQAGQVLSAVDPSRGLRGREALASIADDPGVRFVVARMSSRGPAPQPLGALADLAGADPPRAATPPAAPAPKTPAIAVAPERPRSTEPDVLVDGSLAQFPLLDVLGTLALTRQTVELVLDDGSARRGVIVIRSGRVLEVRVVGSVATGQAAFAELVASPGTRFSVVKRAAPVRGEPLGFLAEWVSDARRVVPLPVRRTLVEGAFDAFSFRDVLEVAATSRQRLSVETWDGGRPRGRLIVKGGILVEATTTDGRIGVPALQALLANPGDRYVLARESNRAPWPKPIGPLSVLVAEPVASPGVVLLDGVFTGSSHGSGSAAFTLDEVLEVAALSRSCLELRVWGRRSGNATLKLKSGHVIGATCGAERDPVRVLADLLADPGDQFEVVRVATPRFLPGAEPLASVLHEARLLVEDSATVLALVDPPEVSTPPSIAPSRAARARARSDRATLPEAEVEQTPTLVPAADVAAVDELTKRVLGLERALADRPLRRDVEDLLELVVAGQRRLEEQDRVIARLSAAPPRRARSDAWLTVLVVVVQLATLAAAVVIALMAWMGPDSGAP